MAKRGENVAEVAEVEVAEVEVEEIEEVELDDDGLEGEDVPEDAEEAEEAEEAEDAEDAEDAEAVEAVEAVEDTDAYPELPVYEEPLAEPNEGFDFFGTVHTDLKASGYVANQGETKALLTYLAQMMFFDALENGEHKIPDIGSIYSEVIPSKERVATFDMPGKDGAAGTPKGETYLTASKHKFSFRQSPSGTRALAEVATLEGWSPEDFIVDEEDGDEEA
jgi:hypothetical protein